MSVFNTPVSVTSLGLDLVAKTIVGEKIQFSHMSTSDFEYPENTDFSGFSDIDGVVQTVVSSDA